MRLGSTGVPCILLGHRKREFLETTVESIRVNATGITDLIVVDDSGDHDHHQWLDDHGFQFTLSEPAGGNCGYLGAMQTVWETAHDLRLGGAEYVLLWEEDFTLNRRLDVRDMVDVMDANSTLAQLNLQRQAVYKVERRLGYMESHARRGYGVVRQNTNGIPWVRRRKPFTTNPGLLRSDVVGVPWPSRKEADGVKGGAEPAMSQRLERLGYTFGWLGNPNVPYTTHVGHIMKSGKGY